MVKIRRLDNERVTATVSKKNRQSSRRRHRQSFVAVAALLPLSVQPLENVPHVSVLPMAAPAPSVAVLFAVQPKLLQPRCPVVVAMQLATVQLPAIVLLVAVQRATVRARTASVQPVSRRNPRRASLKKIKGG